MSPTTASIVISNELESHGDTSYAWLNRYLGEQFIFTVWPDGYGQLSGSFDNEPRVVCRKPQNDTKGLCGA